MSSPSKILNLPNILSLIRLIFVPITVWLLLEELYDFTFFIFIFCCLTDGLDGYIAKRFKLETNLGRILDPIADKALLMSVFLALGFEGFMESWIVIAAIFRDSLIIFGSILLYMFYNEYKFIQDIVGNHILQIIQCQHLNLSSIIIHRCDAHVDIHSSHHHTITTHTHMFCVCEVSAGMLV